MGFFKKIFSPAARANRWLTQDEERLRQAKSAKLRPSQGEPDEDADYDGPKRAAEDYSAWEEIDNMRINFFIGGWATKKLRSLSEGKLIKERQAAERKKAAAEGKGYKTKLELDLEAVARKREDKERLKAEKRRQKEERKGRA